MAEERVAPAARPGARTARPGTVRPLRDVDAVAVRRLATGIGELDRVLGGGQVGERHRRQRGLADAGRAADEHERAGHEAAAGKDVLYVSAEESPAQVRLRAERLTPAALDVPVLAET